MSAEEKKKVQCPDPDCNFENDADAEECGLCHLDIKGFLQLDRILSVRDKVAKKNAAPPKPEPKKRTGLASLIGGR